MRTELAGVIAEFDRQNSAGPVKVRGVGPWDVTVAVLWPCCGRAVTVL